MKKMILTTLLLTLTLVVRAESSSSSGDPSAGTTKFVSDELTIMLRAGPSNKHKIIRALTTGTKLQAFESENSYERVRTHTHGSSKDL